MMTVVCLDSGSGKSRYVEDILVPCCCLASDAVSTNGTLERYNKGDLVRVVIIEASGFTSTHY